MRNPIKSLLEQTAIYGLSSILGRFLNYLLVPLYTSLFYTNEYGVVNELYAYVSILLIVLTYGMETGFFRFCQKSDYKASTVYSTGLSSLIVSSSLFFFVFYIFRHRVAVWIDYQNHLSYLMLLAATVTLDALSAIPFAKLRIENKAKRFAIIKFINIGINIGLNLFFLLFVPKYLGENNIFYQLFFNGLDVGYIFLANFLASLITIFLLIPQIIEAFKPYNFDFGLLKKMLNYSYPLLFAGIAGMMSENFDRILLKQLVEVPANLDAWRNSFPSGGAELTANDYVMSQVGIYGANVKLAVIMTLAIQAFRYAAEPFFFNHSKQSNSRQLYANVMKYFVFFALIVFLGVTLFIDIVKYYIDAKFHAGLSVVPILLISKMFAGIVFNLSIWYKLTNKTQYGALLSFIGAFVSVALNVWLIPHFSYIGSAWAAFFAYGSMMIVSYVLLQKYYPIKYDLRKIFIYIVVAVIIFFINVYLRNITNYYNLINVLLFTIFIFLFAKMEKLEIKALLNFKK